MKESTVCKEFFENANGAIFLIITILSLIIAQSPLSDGYIDLREYSLAALTLTHLLTSEIIGFVWLGNILKTVPKNKQIIKPL